MTVMTVGTEVSHFVCSLNLRDSPDAPDNGLPRHAILRSSEAPHHTVTACVFWAEEKCIMFPRNVGTLQPDYTVS